MLCLFRRMLVSQRRNVPVVIGSSTTSIDWSMVMRAIAFVLIFMGIAAFFSVAYACDCMARTPEQHFMNAAAVFVGEFQEARRNINQTERNGEILVDLGTIDATFKVTRAVKGEARIGELITVRTLSHGSACGVTRWADEKPGTLWVIYANQTTGPRPMDPSDDVFSRELVPLTAETILVTTACSGTSRGGSARAAEHLTYFDSR